MLISEEHQRTIRAMVAADPEVALATCDIPHLEPAEYLREGDADDALPYCGCFVGVYAWMQESKRGNETPHYHEVPNIVAARTGHSVWDISDFATWCNTPAKDRLAVLYARDLFVTANQE